VALVVPPPPVETWTFVGAETCGAVETAPDAGFDVLTLTLVGALTCGGGLFVTGGTCAAAGVVASDRTSVRPAATDGKIERCMQHLQALHRSYGRMPHAVLDHTAATMQMPIAHVPLRPRARLVPAPQPAVRLL
jgi:hypothetical protein